MPDDYLGSPILPIKTELYWQGAPYQASSGTTSYPATFYAVFDRIVPAANKYMATLFNTSSTRKVVIQRAWVYNWQIVAITGILLEQYLARITARTEGTSVNIQTLDTNDILSPGIAADTNSTVVTEAHIIKRCRAVSEEGALTVNNISTWLQASSLWALIYDVKEGTKGITLRQNQGITFRNITSSVVGTVSYVVEFTDEAA